MSARMDAFNAAGADLRALRALADLLMQVDASDLRDDTLPAIGEVLDGISDRLADAVGVLGDGGAP